MSSLLVVSGTSRSVAAQTPASIGSIVLAVNDDEAPLQLVEFQPQTDPKHGPYIIVRNVSKKAIVRFTLLPRYIVPKDCMLEAGSASPQDQCAGGAEEFQYREEEGKPSAWGLDVPMVPASATGRVYLSALSPSGLVGLAQRFKSNYLQIQIVVSEVNFVDGDRWRRGDPCPTVSPDLVAVAPQGCVQWRSMKPSVLDVRETIVVPSAESGLLPQLPAAGPSFATSCRIIKIAPRASDDWYTAVCPPTMVGSALKQRPD